MEKPCLRDKDEYPDDGVLERYLGKKMNLWTSFLDYVEEDYPSFTTEWRYYNDGKNWLFKIKKKTKTICWVSIYDDMFKTTFYFTDKAEDLLRASRLRREYVDKFITGKKYGKVKGVTVDIKRSTDLEMTKILIEIKEKMK